MIQLNVLDLYPQDVWKIGKWVGGWDSQNRDWLSPKAPSGLSTRVKKF